MITNINNRKRRSLCTKLVGLSFVIYHLLFSVACNDFLTIYPTDKTVGTDFWKTKGDVQGMVDGAYSSMTAYSVQERAIIWGAFRSDELVKRSGFSNQTLDNISAMNLLPTNGYNSWAGFYNVINRCNIVLKHAPEVMLEDPEFTEGDYQVVRAQMLALRSLCYFYLVRTFHDVPMTEESFEDDSQNMVLEQSAPAVVLQKCLDDLAEAEQYIMKSGAYGYGDWRNKGYMTRDAVCALMADIYLWRASMTHSATDYGLCISYVDKVIAAKDQYYKQYHQNGAIASTGDIYHLENANLAMYTIFGEGNSHESILEWQYGASTNYNEALENLYHQEGNKDSYRQYGMVLASSIFNSVDPEKAHSEQELKVFFSRNDYRFWNNVYEANNEEAQQLNIRKMVDASTTVVSTTGATGISKPAGSNYEGFKRNWIVYRLTDLMLMKAEALVETAGDDADRMEQAFNLVQTVNKRSMLSTARDTLVFSDFKTKTDMELLVMAERERELCFEGKRWWDLVRYCYRHMEGVDINARLADRDSWPELYKPMLKMVVRKYGDSGEGDAVTFKMKSEPFLYWPVQESETKVNPLIKQNPVYIQEKSTAKN
ncbi:MAG: RagB/SusD family nutrient uptake outer membrane protein [Prevotella sp.]|nr:RagB/SusD family nutrient uptake outer membrane protein [Prevotella sp.]